MKRLVQFLTNSKCSVKGRIIIFVKTSCYTDAGKRQNKSGIIFVIREERGATYGGISL